MVYTRFGSRCVIVRAHYAVAENGIVEIEREDGSRLWTTLSELKADGGINELAYEASMVPAVDLTRKEWKAFRLAGCQ